MPAGSLMERELRSFSTGLYRGIASGTSLRTAFNLAVAQVEIEGQPDVDIPHLLARSDIDVDRPFAEEAEPAPPAAEPPAATGGRVEKIGDRHWGWQGWLPLGQDAAQARVRAALQPMNVRSVKSPSPSVLQQGPVGSFPGDFDATEEITVTLAADQAGTRVGSRSQSLQLSIADYGHNERNFRLLAGLLQAPAF
ncbi:MAG TPA: hypothetical protein VGP30_00840 [Candidatus Limnocylindrales bacterium]|nr:hypothetical protein [Candidatus Limnocylindrales bacterium]